MNDPFGVRKPSPRSPLQATFGHSSDYFDSRTGSAASQIPSGQANGQKGQDQPADRFPRYSAMSSQPHSEWRPRRVTNPQNLPSSNPPSNVTNVSDKINNMLSHSEEEELPMYKDKPYNYAASDRRLPFWRRQRLTLFLLGVLIIILYLASSPKQISKPTIIGGGGDESKSKSSTWSLLKSMSGGGRNGDPDWDDRRERVRDAFKISWEAYEKAAWGLSLPGHKSLLPGLIFVCRVRRVSSHVADRQTNGGTQRHGLDYR